MDRDVEGVLPWMERHREQGSEEDQVQDAAKGRWERSC